MTFSGDLAAQSHNSKRITRHSDIRPDFNGDGYADLAIGATGERFGDANAAGA